MRSLVSLVVVLAVVISRCQPVAAQPGSAPAVCYAQTGADTLLKRFESALMLTSPAEQKQWKHLKEHFEIFLKEVDRTKPSRVELLFDKIPIRYRTAFPVPNIRRFRKNNLDKVGVETRRRSGTLYRTKPKQAYEGFMRYAHGYAIFATTRSDLPRDIADPAAVAPLLKGSDAIIHGLNSVKATAAIAERRKWFAGQHKEMLSVVKRRDTETPDDFKLRKLLYEHQLDELARMYADGAEMLLAANIVPAAGKSAGIQAVVDLRLSAIPDTSLAESLKMAGKEKSHFAGVPRCKDPVLSLRLNHHLDDMRKANFLETFALIKERSRNRIADDENRNAGQKKAATQFVEKLHTLFAASTRAGVADGFMEVHPNPSGKNTAVMAMQHVDGTSAIEMLKLLPAAGNNQSVELNIDKVGDVQIHKAKLAISEFIHLAKFFGAEDTVFVGTEKKAVWMASGENALAELKAAIKAAAEKKDARPEDPFFALFARLAPLMEVREKAAGKKGFPIIRKHAIEAFKPGDDELEVTLSRKNGQVVGRMRGDTGLIRLIGKILADFSRENLDDTKVKKKPRLKSKSS